MTMQGLRIENQVEKEMNKLIPEEELRYRNGIVAHAVAIGKMEQLTEDWVRKTLLGDVQDGFLTYEQALAIKDRYFEAIETIKRMF